MICGVVLAGGRSVRFGREKAMAELGGRPLIAWAAASIEAKITALAVSACAGSGAALYASAKDWTVLADAPCDPEGPLAGVAAGLRWAADLGAEAICTVPCDAPFLPSDLVAHLSEAQSAGGAAVASTPDGLEPLCALWPVGALAMLKDWRGRPAPRDLLYAMKAAEVAFPDPAAFANLNTPEDFAAAERAAARDLRGRAAAAAR